MKLLGAFLHTGVRVAKSRTLTLFAAPVGLRLPLAPAMPRARA